MPDLNYLAVTVAAAASFLASAGWYAVLGDEMARLQARWRGADPAAAAPAWTGLVFVASNLVLALVVAYLFELVGVSGWLEALGLGVLLWVGFCLTQWIGSVLGESVPLRLAAIHGGDWLAHLAIISVVVGAWQ